MTVQLHGERPLPPEIAAFCSGPGLSLGFEAWRAYDLLAAAYRDSGSVSTTTTVLAEQIFGQRVTAWVTPVPCPTCGTTEPYCDILAKFDQLRSCTFPIWVAGEVPSWHRKRLSCLRHPRGTAARLLYAAGY